jgi:protein SSD1
MNNVSFFLYLTMVLFYLHIATPLVQPTSPRHTFQLVPFTPTRVNFARDDANPHQRRPLFIAHLPFSALTPLFQSRQLVRGMLRVNKRNRSDAYVYSEELDADIYIAGSRDRNRALEGDVVAVRLIDVDKVLQEKREKEEIKLVRGQARIRLPDEEDENEIIFGGDDEVEVVKPKFSGVVVAILERAQNQVFSG